MFDLLALNPLKPTDIIFFVVLAVIVALCIVFYLLIPVINKKQYREMRDNLHKREVAFRSNVQRAENESPAGDLSDDEKAAQEKGEALPYGMPSVPTEHEEK